MVIGRIVLILIILGTKKENIFLDEKDYEPRHLLKRKPIDEVKLNYILIMTMVFSKGYPELKEEV